MLSTAAGSFMRRALSERRSGGKPRPAASNASVVLADSDLEQGAPGLRFNTRLKTAAVRFAW